jgi:hypothetical protein
MRSVTQAPAIHLRLMVRFPRKDPILFQLGLKAAELPCFESETEHRSAAALEDSHRLLLQCGNWKFIFLEIAMHKPKAPTRPQDIHLPYMGRCTQVNLHRIMAASNSPMTPSRFQERHMTSKLEAFLLVAHQQATPQGSKFQRLMHTRDVHEYDYISRRLLQLLEYNYINACLRQRRAPPRDVISWLHRLYLNLVVLHDYSSPGRTGSTSTLSCPASTRLSAAAALHRLRRTPPRRRLLGVQLLRLLTLTSKLVEGGYYVINN